MIHDSGLLFLGHPVGFNNADSSFTWSVVYRHFYEYMQKL